MRHKKIKLFDIILGLAWGILMYIFLKKIYITILFGILFGIFWSLDEEKSNDYLY